MDNGTLCVKVTDLGGALCSIRDRDGVEYLWQGDKTYWSGQAPVLFPICGSIRNDCAETGGGKKMQMPRHGIVRKRDFTCSEQTKDSILFKIQDDEVMYEQFPYHFALSIRYTLTEKEITVTYRIENRGEEEMPFFIGGHPGFNCPLIAGEEYGDYFIEFSRKETCTVPKPVTETGLIDMGERTAFLNGEDKLALSHELFSVDAVILDELSSREVRLRSVKSEKGVEVRFHDFPYLILWSSANGGPFVAIEPWTGLSTCSDESDVFEDKRNVQIAKGGETKEYSYTIKVL